MKKFTSIVSNVILAHRDGNLLHEYLFNLHFFLFVYSVALRLFISSLFAYILSFVLISRFFFTLNSAACYLHDLCNLPHHNLRIVFFIHRIKITYCVTLIVIHHKFYHQIVNDSTRYSC